MQTFQKLFAANCKFLLFCRQLLRFGLKYVCISSLKRRTTDVLKACTFAKKHYFSSFACVIVSVSLVTVEQI